MQIKAAQEVRDCQTEVFFGMNLRQLVFTGLAGASAVLCWFLLRDRLSMETISWLCILAEKKLLELYMQEERKGKAHAFKRKEGKDKTP